MADSLLITRLRKLSEQLKKEADQANEKSCRIMMDGPDKPMTEWTPAERHAFCSMRTETRIRRSDKLLAIHFDLKHAAEDLDSLIRFASRKNMLSVR